MSTTTYDPTQIAGNMHLTEAEICLALQMDNDLCSFEVEYDLIKRGDALILTGDEPDEGEQSLRCKLGLYNVEGGVTTIHDWETGIMSIGEVGDSFRERPHCKMFEAVILERKHYEFKPGDEVFGLLFPDGHAILVDSGPEDDFTNRRILAMIAMRQAERVES